MAKHKEVQKPMVGSLIRGCPQDTCQRAHHCALRAEIMIEPGLLYFMPALAGEVEVKSLFLICENYDPVDEGK